MRDKSIGCHLPACSILKGKLWVLLRGGSCRTPHHRQEGLLPHAAPQTSGPIAARRTTDK